MQIWRERILFILKSIKTIKPCSILDLGCGNGRVMEYIIRVMPDIKLYGLDKSHRQCERLKRKYENLKQVEIIEADFRSYHMKFSQNIDIVLLIEVIEHLEWGDVYLLIKKICFELSPLYVLITTPNKDFNIYLSDLTEKGFRNLDHKFELTSTDADLFVNTCRKICKAYNINRCFWGENHTTHYIIFERK